MVLITRGTGWLEWNGTTFALAAPVLFWLHPGVEHVYAPDLGGWNEWWALFAGDAADAYQRFGYIPRDHPVGQVTDAATLEVAFSALARACGPESPNADVEAAAATHQLIVTARRCGMPATVTKTPVLAALLANACQPTTVSGHARRLGVTEAALRAATRRAAGCGPKEFILRARLSRAKELLTTTALSVVAVARRTGYDDPGYFTRLFTHRTGLSPSEFRLQQRRGVADPA
ncbi:MAG: AraC family transcriptional regulator, partial [Micromonosporaceae bacterium]